MAAHQLTVNGRRETIEVLDDTPLLWVLPPLAPALTAAIHDATGVRIRRLPVEDQLRA